MIGLLTLFLLFILIFVVNLIATRFSKDFSSDDNPKLRKRLYRGMVFFIIFILIGDEIIGGTQMAYFCLVEPDVQVLIDDLEGRKVRGTTEFHIKESAILEVKKGTRKFIDVESQELVATGYTYISQGGWLSQAIAFNGSKKPILFNESCSNTKEFYQLISSNQMTLER